MVKLRCEVDHESLGWPGPWDWEYHGVSKEFASCSKCRKKIRLPEVVEEPETHLLPQVLVDLLRQTTDEIRRAIVREYTLVPNEYGPRIKTTVNDWISNLSEFLEQYQRVGVEDEEGQKQLKERLAELVNDYRSANEEWNTVRNAIELVFHLIRLSLQTEGEHSPSEPSWEVLEEQFKEKLGLVPPKEETQGGIQGGNQ